MLAEDRGDGLFIFNLIFFFVCLAAVLLAVFLYSGKRAQLKKEMEEGKQIKVEVKDLVQMQMAQDAAAAPAAAPVETPAVEPAATTPAPAATNVDAYGESDC